eukprot:3023026-Rhodomonas_salina.1
MTFRPADNPEKEHAQPYLTRFPALHREPSLQSSVFSYDLTVEIVFAMICQDSGIPAQCTVPISRPG